MRRLPEQQPNQRLRRLPTSSIVLRICVTRPSQSPNASTSAPESSIAPSTFKFSNSDACCRSKINGASEGALALSRSSVCLVDLICPRHPSASSHVIRGAWRSPIRIDVDCSAIWSNAEMLEMNPTCKRRATLSARRNSINAITRASAIASSENNPWFASTHGQMGVATPLLAAPAAGACRPVAAPLHRAIASADAPMVRAAPGLAGHARVTDRSRRGKAHSHRASRHNLHQKLHRALPRTRTTCAQSLAFATEAGAAHHLEGAPHGR